MGLYFSNCREKTGDELHIATGIKQTFLWKIDSRSKPISTAMALDVHRGRSFHLKCPGERPGEACKELHAEKI